MEPEEKQRRRLARYHLRRCVVEAVLALLFESTAGAPPILEVSPWMPGLPATIEALIGSRRKRLRFYKSFANFHNPSEAEKQHMAEHLTHVLRESLESSELIVEVPEPETRRTVPPDRP